MAGWNCKQGDVKSNVSNNELRKMFLFVFSSSCKKRSTYKYGLIKSILDNLFNFVFISDMYEITYDRIFEKFTENYWNLVVKYRIHQMRKDGKSSISKIETILQKEEYSKFVNFENIPSDIKTKIIKDVKKECKKNVVGALYCDFDGLLYGFDNKKEVLRIQKEVYTFLTRYKLEIEKLNYYSWATFLSNKYINNDENLIRLLDKLELSTPKRRNLLCYKKILLDKCHQATCFYCGRELSKNIEVDHFIPWSYMKEDNIWNLVLTCKSCNRRKSDRLVDKDKIIDIEKRNLLLLAFRDIDIDIDMKTYKVGDIDNIWNCANDAGYKTIKL